MRRVTFFLVFVLSLAVESRGVDVGAARPTILYTDLDSGPNSGGDNGAGVYVTVYGRGFGQTQGASTITIGGGAAFAYNFWSDTKVTIQVGAAARTGAVVVHTAVGDSNGVSFTVRAGGIFFVAPGGVDFNSGASGRPWRTIQHAVETIRPGDTVYVMDGVVETRPGSSDGSVEIASSGSPGLPKTLVAFPGARAIIGSPGSGVCASDYCVEGLVTLDLGTPYTDWTIAGLTFRGNNKAFLVTGGARPNNLSSRWRVIGNDFSCPNMHSLSGPGCVTFAQTQNVVFHGNRIHDVGKPGDEVQEYGQGLYFTTDTIHVDAGWNEVANVKGCRCVQVHSSPLANGDSSDPTGYNQFDISIHDNLIHDCGCDGLLLWSVDPSRGPINVYNNVIYNAGAGPAPRSGSGNFGCLYMAATTNNSSAPAPSGTVDVYNNTLFNCGGAHVKELSMAIRSGGDRENPNVVLRLRNNIVQVPPGTPYISEQGNRVVGSNNLWFGAGPPPPNDRYVALTSNLDSDPLFVNPARGDFHPRSGSPAVNAGVDTGLIMDADGRSRHRTPAMDLGAYEHAGPPRIGLFSCEPAVVKTPGPSDCIVILTSEATDGAVSITLGSDNSLVPTPASVTVPGGGSSAGFQVFFSAVLRVPNVTLTASTPDQQEIFRLSLVPPALPTVTGLVNAASFQAGPVSPGEVVTVQGSNLGPETGVSLRLTPDGSHVERSLGETTSFFDGIPAPLLYAQTNQINAVVPYTVAGKNTVSLQVVVNGLASDPVSIPVTDAAPAIFAQSANGVGPAAAINQDGMVNSPANPAPRGSILAFFATGAGPTVPDSTDGLVSPGATSLRLNVGMQIGGLDAPVLYAGAAPLLVAGMVQVNARVPEHVTPGVVPVVMIVAGRQSPNGITISVR